MERETAGIPPRNAGNIVFFNQRGLRPGWRILIFLLVLVVSGSLLLGLAQMFRPAMAERPMAMLPSRMLLAETLMLLPVVFASWIMSLVERRSLGDYGLPLRGPALLPRALRGYVFWGFLPLSLLLLVLRALHVFYFGGLAVPPPQIFSWALAWGLVFVMVGLAEEYTFRGYLLHTLAEGMGFWPAAMVLAALFAWVHAGNPGESRIGLAMVAAFALFASITLRRTGNLWLAVGAHAGWDWGQSFVYGVSDSGLQVQGHLLNPHIQGPAWLNGGTVGPEGSVLSLVAMAALSALVVVFWRKENAPALPARRQLSG